MRTAIQIISIESCLVLLTFLGKLSCAAQTEPIFEKGQTCEYEITLPKVGIVGSTDPVGYPKRLPAGEQDFAKRFLRVTVLEMRSLTNGQRVVLRLDEIDKYRRLRFKGLYYAYMDIQPEGARTFSRLRDDGIDVDNRGVQAALPFPFACTAPPALGLRGNTRGGYLTATGLGVDLAVRRSEKAGSAVEIEATCFNKHGAPSDNLPQTIRWHGAEIADVARTNATTRILCREKQEWERTDDWLWKKMERRDEHGYLVMRCVQLTHVPTPPKQPQGRK